MDKNKLVQNFINTFKYLANEKSLTPSEVTEKIFFESNIYHIDKLALKKLGSFKDLKAQHFEDEEDYKTIYGSKLVRSFKQKLARKKGVDDYLTEEFLNVFKEHIKNEPLLVHKNTKTIRSNLKKERAVVVHVSDTHFGANIKADEMGLVNEFNWEIAARRMALFAKQVVEYKPHYRDSTELVICINGDIIAGVIHDQEWFSDLLATQFSGTLKILMQFVSYCAKHYPKVTVHCTPGNHGRAMHKSGKSRATTHKWDSYENMIYVALREAIQISCRNTIVNVPKTPYVIVDVLGHKGFVTHGDTVINVGNPGKNINMKAINTQINSLNSSKLAEVKFEFIMCGHCHVSNIQITDNGAYMLTNGTLSGADPFAQSIGIFGNQPSQTLFEVTRSHAVGDIRLIKLIEADKDKSLDAIIVPPKEDL